MKKADATRENRTEGFTNAVEFETGELSKVTGQAVIDFGRSIGAIHDQGAGELILIQLSDK